MTAPGDAAGTAPQEPAGESVEALAGRYWDAEVKPTLGQEFLADLPDGVAYLRRRYVLDVVQSPEAVAEIRAWATQSQH